MTCGTAQAIVILVAEVVSALVTSVWLPWGAGAGMDLISFLFCVARIVVAVLQVILTPTAQAQAVIEAVVRILGRVGFDHSRRPVDSGLIGVLSLLGCCGPRRGGRERRHCKATEVRHSPVARDSFAARDSSPYVPPNASFAQKDKGSSSSYHSGGPPPSILRPEHALQPYREDSAESGYIMGAWQPFPGPGPRSSSDRTSISTPPQHANSGFSRIGGGRAHYDSPYAIASETGGSSTFTFPSMESKRSGPVSVGTPTKTMKNYLLQLLP
ncbi:hypothetical protein EV424DRAFT_1547104 [Suillus variegatus]|nr:hypothetical protein EV424DRAFT_1547104 [Suillus variegatus]